MISRIIDGFSKFTCHLQWRTKNLGATFFKHKSQVNFGGVYLNWEKENSVFFIFMVPCIINLHDNIQRDATTSSQYFLLLQYHSTPFGCSLHPSSGVQETVVTATGIRG
jgi:hypothetical protein